MKKSTDAQIRAAAKYDKNNTILIQLKLNKKTDADILECLDQQDNRQGFIKMLIRKHMLNEKFGISNAESVPVINKRIVEGEFLEGQNVVVSIDGKEFRRKVWYSEKCGDLVITVLGNEYAKYEFENSQ